MIDARFVTVFGAHQLLRVARLGQRQPAYRVAPRRGQYSCNAGINGASWFEQLFVEQFFARQRAFLRGQRLVFEGLEFRRDVALGIFQRLAATVIVGHLVGLARCVTSM